MSFAGLCCPEMKETLGSWGEMSALIALRSLTSLWDGLVQEGGCHLWKDLKFGVRITAGLRGAPHLSSSFACPGCEKGPENTLWGLELDNLYSPFLPKPLQDSINFHGYGHHMDTQGAVRAPMPRASAILSLQKQTKADLSLSHPFPIIPIPSLPRC